MNSKQYHYKIIVSIFVFIIVFFSVIAPIEMFSFDFDTEVIFNSVITSSYTGGKSGVGGKDGEPGQPGENGRVGGKDGISIISSSSSASVYVGSTIDGKRVVDVYEQVSGDGADAVSYTSATDTDSAFAEQDEPDVVDEHLAQESLSSLEKVLLSIRLILLKYVNILF